MELGKEKLQEGARAKSFYAERKKEKSVLCSTCEYSDFIPSALLLSRLLTFRLITFERAGLLLMPFLQREKVRIRSKGG